MSQPINERAEERLRMILEKDLNDLTETDKAFLRARRGYIGKRSQERLKHILKDKNPERVNPDETKITDTVPKEVDHPANQVTDDGDEE